MVMVSHVLSQGKLPFIELNGVAVADSSFIIEHLIAHFHIELDAHLSAKQRAVGNGLQRTVEGVN